MPPSFCAQCLICGRRRGFSPSYFSPVPAGAISQDTGCRGPTPELREEAPRCHVPRSRFPFCFPGLLAPSLGVQFCRPRCRSLSKSCNCWLIATLIPCPRWRSQPAPPTDGAHRHGAWGLAGFAPLLLALWLPRSTVSSPPSQ